MRYLTIIAATLAAFIFGGQAAMAGAFSPSSKSSSKASAGAIAGAAAVNKTTVRNSVSSRNKNYNTNVNANSNSNRNSNVNVAKGGSAKQAQGQVQGQKQALKAKTGDISIEGDTVTYKAAASTAPLVGIDPTAPCQVGVSAGASVPGVSAGFGTSVTSETCVQGEQTRFVCQIATHKAYASFQDECIGMVGELEYVKEYRAKRAEEAKPAAVASLGSSLGSDEMTATPASFEAE